MKKTFCDNCGAEITDINITPVSGLIGNNSRIAKDAVVIKFQAVITNDDCEKDFCKYCLIDAINCLDDRPTECV